jgi:hypothetical protein
MRASLLLSRPTCLSARFLSSEPWRRWQRRRTRVALPAVNGPSLVRVATDHSSIARHRAAGGRASGKKHNEHAVPDTRRPTTISHARQKRGHRVPSAAARLCRDRAGMGPFMGVRDIRSVRASLGLRARRIVLRAVSVPVLETARTD